MLPSVRLRSEAGRLSRLPHVPADPLTPRPKSGDEIARDAPPKYPAIFISWHDFLVSPSSWRNYFVLRYKYSEPDMMPAGGRAPTAGYAGSRRARKVSAVSLSAHEQQELDLIEDEIAGSDPALASLLATFARPTADGEPPAQEQIRAGRRPRGRRRLPAPGTFRRPGRPIMSPDIVVVLLWLMASIALVVSALVISRGGGKGCAMPAVTCAGQAPAHGLRPGTARLPAGQTQDAPGQLGTPGR